LDTAVRANEDHGVADDVSVEEAWQKLAADPRSVLIDVRTQAEWAYVGVPDLASLGKQVVLAEWQGYPSGRVHDDFAQRLTETLTQAGADKESDLLFLCRSGVRSLAAARVMVASGFTRSFNVAGGFEGPLDGDHHRGRTQGWKARGLPWVQS
jgi:rhodanese-related sulfurtransferase